MRFSRSLFACLSVLVWLAGVLPAQAQANALALASLQIELWPEFDRPSTLVILSGTLAPGVTLPAEVTLRLPAATGGPFAVATRSTTNDLTNAPYTTTLSGDQILVTFKTDLADFHVEYYDPALTVAGQARDYVFKWTTDYAVRDVSLSVQQPAAASNLVGDPALTPAGPGQYGLNYYNAALGALSAGQAVSVHLTYSKASAALSSEVVGQNAPTPAPRAALPITVNSPGLWVGGVAVLLAVAGGGYWYLAGRSARPGHRSQKAGWNDSHRRARRPGREAGSTPAEVSDAALPARFCPQCGHRQQAGDLFCRQCGAPARK